MLKRLFHIGLALFAVVITLLLFSILSVAPMMFVDVQPVMAHPGTPDPDRDFDGVSDDLDTCPDEPGEGWYGGCPYTPQAPVAGGTPPAGAPPAAQPPAAAPVNPVTARNFLPTDRESILALLADGTTEIVPTPILLDFAGGTANQAVTELQELELLETGTVSIQQNYLFLNGRGDLFLGVGSGSASENAVISAQLSFTSYDTAQFELCSIAARVGRDGSRNATTLLDIALVNDGSVAVIDRSDPRAEAAVVVADLDLDLTVPHRLMAVIDAETVNVYVNGELAIKDFAAVVREGGFGMSMVGRASTSPRCEARNFWVYTF